MIKIHPRIQITFDQIGKNTRRPARHTFRSSVMNKWGWGSDFQAAISQPRAPRYPQLDSVRIQMTPSPGAMSISSSSVAR
jgi:hypothetical protein